jgi:glycerol-3-phosphate dehydrogenase
VKPVLILGAGINGAAVARDLAINGIPVCIVDTSDVAGGATSRSSRLIHGGLRYLEYRDTALVRESLLERERMLKLAPQFVKPLRLTIPVKRRFGGLWAGFVRFSGLARTPFGRHLLKLGRGPRGLLAIKAGLMLYDHLARSDALPPHDVLVATRLTKHSQSDHENTETDSMIGQFRWLCSYSDAQITFPERFVLAMLEDARRAAQETGSMFDVLPYHKAVASESSSEISIVPVQDSLPAREVRSTRTIVPSTIINATGAWGDRTLETLGVREKHLFAGTKGSHLFTSHPPLVDALNGNGIYAEANDGRLVFILPCAGGVLIGTTDEPFHDDPSHAVATPDEVDYLLNMVSEVFPNVGLTANHVSMHHAGVRPLPKCDGDAASAIPRGHSIEESTLNDIPVLTLVGGKLTTCRSLAEEVCRLICSMLNQKRSHDTTVRPIPGANNVHPDSPSAEQLTELAMQYNLHVDQVAVVWSLIGNRFDEVFASRDNACGNAINTHRDEDSLRGTTIPKSFVRWSIDREWCAKLDDLVERRLMLIFHSTVCRTTLEELATELVNAGQLEASGIDEEIERASQRLQKFYGKTVVRD